ncbi:hypothetical protein NMG60_11017356 [Bertholletia excelsa]
MAASWRLLCSRTLKPNIAVSLRSLSTLATTTTNNSTGAISRRPEHEYLQPNQYLNSWKRPKDPKEAEAKLAQLRREYAKKVKEIRKEYILEMELQRLEKQRKDEARREAIRVANEERRAAKAASKKAKAAEREVAEEEFRQTLLKERADKLEYWRRRQAQIVEKKKEKKELLRRQSSMWINESDLEKTIVERIINITSL